MGVGEFRGGKGGGVKWTEHLFLMLCTFKDNTTYLIQFQINYILYPTDHVYKKICKRSAETPFTATTSPMSVTTSPSPHLLLLQTRWHTHYIDIHRYLPFPVLLAHTDVGESPSLGDSPHTYTLDLYCLVQSVSLVNTGDYSPCIVNPDGWRKSYLAEILQHARKLTEC